MKPSRRQPSGFILLEAILAMSILSVVAVSLTVALNKLGEVALASQREMAMMRSLQTLMTWNLRDPFIQPKQDESPPDAYGITYQTLIEEMPDIQNMDGQTLQEMLRIRIRAYWAGPSGTVEEEVIETYRYARLYRSNA